MKKKNDLRRHILTVIAAAIGVLIAVTGPIAFDQASPTIGHPLCVGDLLRIGYCDRVTHNLHGGYIIGFVATLVGGILTAIVAAIIDGISTD